MRTEADKNAKTITMKSGIIDRRSAPVLSKETENRSRKR